MSEATLSNVSKIKTDFDKKSDKPANDYISNVSMYLGDIISGMPCWVYWKNAEFVYLGCNDLAANSLKIPSKHAIVGMTDYDFGWDKEKVNAFRKIDEDILRTGQPQLNLEETVLTNDNRIIHLLVNKMPIFDENKRVVGIVGISVDITEKKRVENELILAKEAAEAADKLKSEFILNMEHDIRTPFAGILGMTEMLDSLETDLSKKQIIADIRESTKELLDYSCGILDFSNIEGGHLPVLLKKIQFKEFIHSIVAIESPAAKIKQLDFMIECDDNIPKTIIGDGYRLKRILINLISNAIKFTDKGFVRLLVKCLKINSKNVIMSFIVEDSGIGIEEKKLNVIYEKFSRLTLSSQGIYKGTGLGLRIVKQFAEEMDGDVEIKSILGQGSRFVCTFSFKLPVFEEE